MKRIHRYNQFKILKEGRSYEASIGQAIDFIRNKATEWSIENKQILRGISGSDDISFSIVEPSKHTRSTIGLSYNSYNILVDNLPSWEKYPKRHNSIYGMFIDEHMTSEEYLKWIENTYQYNEFGYVNFMIPENGAKLAVCESSDFRKSLYSGHKRPEDRNTSYKAVGIYKVPYVFESLNKLFFDNKLDLEKWTDLEKTFKLKLEYLKEQYEIIENNEHDTFALAYIYDIIDAMENAGYNTTYEFFNTGYSPENNNMKLIEYNKTSINNLTSEDSEGSEIWTDSDCLIVNPRVMSKLLKRL